MYFLSWNLFFHMIDIFGSVSLSRDLDSEVCTFIFPLASLTMEMGKV